MTFDAHANLASGVVSVAPSTPTGGLTMTVVPDSGVSVPAVPFSAVVAPAGAAPTHANAEIVRISANASNVWTMARAQEGSTARAILTGDVVYIGGVTAKTLTDIESAITALQLADSQLTAYATGAAGQVSGATNKVQLVQSGGNGPVIVGSDLALHGSGDLAKIDFLTSGIYALTLVAAGYTIAAGSPGAATEGPVTTACLFPRFTGSNAATIDSVALSYVGGAKNGFVANYVTTLRFAAGDTFYMQVVIDTPVDSHASATTNGSPVVTDALIQTRDLGKPVTGTGIPATTYVGTVTAGVSYRLSSTKYPVAQADVNATATGSPVLQIGPDKWNLEGGGATFAKIVRLA